MQTVALPYRPAIDDGDIRQLIGREPFGWRYPAYLKLKLHAALLGQALNPGANLCKPPPLNQRLCGLDLDLVIQSDSGNLSVFEPGTVLDDRVLSILDAGVQTVFVLPYAGLAYSAILANAYMLPGASPVPTLTSSQGRAAFEKLLTDIRNRS
jgi:hypothetical protein